jgi:MFS family permease
MTATPRNEPQPQGEGRWRALPGTVPAMALLLSINLFNYIDRQVLAAVEPEVREGLFPAHSPHDPIVLFKMGLLSTAFLVSYMLTAPLFGLLAERWSRWLLIAVGVGLWSLASGASGLSTSYAMLLVTRCFVGIGEGAYGPIAPALISDLYPVAARGRVLSWFYLAIPVGGALGYALGGEAAAANPAHQSWRWGFYLVVIPGLLLAIWSLMMREPRRGAADQLDCPARRPRLGDYLILVKTPSYVLDTLGMTAMTFSLGALAWWMPAYLKLHTGKFHGLEPRTFFGILTALAGFLATLAGGMAGDLLRKRFPGSYFLVSGLGLWLTVPCILLFMAVPFNAAWIFVFLAVFFLFFNTGPTNAILANVTHPSIRATGFALNILVIHILGDAISPPIVGAMADHSRSVGVPPQNALDNGFLAVSSLLLLGGAFWLWGARYLQRDTQAAAHKVGARS